MRIYHTIEHYMHGWKTRENWLFLAYIVLLILIVSSLFYIHDSWFWCLLGLIIGLIGGLWVRRLHDPAKNQAISYLHATNPDFEYSLALLERGGDLLPLELFQREKIFALFKSKPLVLPPNTSLLKRWLLPLILAGLIACLPFILSNPNIRLDNQEETISQSILLEGTSDLDSIRVVIENISIRPPSYTNQLNKETKSREIEILEGSGVRWEVNYLPLSADIFFEFGDENKPIQLAEKHLNKTFNSSTYYRIGGKSNDSVIYNSIYYPIKVIEDKKPQVRVSGISEYQKLPWNKSHKINFDIHTEDDYGLEDLYLSATVAKGAGESVKFREKSFPIHNFEKRSNKFTTSYQLETGSLEMEPGSELYFYVMVKDNCPFRVQATKSKTFFVVLEDTATYGFFDDGGMQVDLMPAFFRSQRQIIIDTENLLASRQQIPIEEFNRRSNELGYDQKLLRLKYGQFLGEESESGIAIENEIDGLEEEHNHDQDDHDHDAEDDRIADWSQEVLEKFGHDHDHEAEANQLLEENGTQPANPARPAWVEELSHNHDSEEENTYFDISIKSKLKAALTEMWDSELHLRLYDPAKSLPYQYKALDLLEEIKNHARVYVHRIGFEPPAIKEVEIRLSGNMDDIKSSFEKQNKTTEDNYSFIKNFVEILGNKNKDKNSLTLSEMVVFEECIKELATLSLSNLSLLPTLQKLQSFHEDFPSSGLKGKERIRSILMKIIPASGRPIADKNYIWHPLKKAAIASIQEDSY